MSQTGPGTPARTGDPPARALLLAGTHSGVGKTSLSLGVMGALARRGLSVAPFKVGPDYIDPTYHAVAAGAPSRNLDTWLMPPEEAVGIFRRGVAAAVFSSSAKPVPGAVGVVEGVMGLFDGLAGGGERCSTAELAKLLDLPVFLVVDTSSMARSVAALVHGFATFDPAVRVAGVILNKVAGESHAVMLRESLAGGFPVLGVVPRRPELHLTSRHLGLIPTVEDEEIHLTLDRIVDHVEEHLDLDALLELARPLSLSELEEGRRPAVAARRGGSAAKALPGRAPRVAVARDSAFSFYYEDNLESLREEGAEVVTFSPLAGEGLPDCQAVYLGGGYPEVYASRLAANKRLQQDLHEAVGSGVRLYAECGGYLYLGESIEYEGVVHRMTGLLPSRASMSAKRLRMGYVEAEALPANPLASERFRGHLFHYSSTVSASGEGTFLRPTVSPAYRVSRKGEVMTDGWAGGSVVASYVHLHFRGSRSVACWLAGGPAEGGEAT